MVDQTNESIFKTPATTEVKEETSQEVSSEVKDDTATLLSSIVTEDGRQKYKSVEDALKALPHAQQHISTLEAEHAALKEELLKRQNAEEVLEQIEASKRAEVTTKTPEVDEGLIDSLIERKLQGKEKQQAAERNAKQVIDSLTSKFGDKAEEMYLQAAKDAGLTVERFNDLAMSSPQAALKLAGVVGPVQAPQRTTSGTNTDAIEPTTHQPSIKVRQGATSKDMTAAWRAAKPVT